MQSKTWKLKLNKWKMYQITSNERTVVKSIPYPVDFKRKSFIRARELLVFNLYLFIYLFI